MSYNLEVTLDICIKMLHLHKTSLSKKVMTTLLEALVIFCLNYCAVLMTHV